MANVGIAASWIQPTKKCGFGKAWSTNYPPFTKWRLMWMKGIVCVSRWLWLVTDFTMLHDHEITWRHHLFGMHRPSKINIEPEKPVVWNLDDDFLKIQARMLRFHVKLRGVCFSFRKFETTQGPKSNFFRSFKVLEWIPCVFLGRGQKSYLTWGKVHS